jgi:predicted Rossmann fold nucleotide-binding protein DprA/Smf involved in DNA uptake
MHIAIVGSRKYPFLDDVKRLVQLIAEDDKKEPGFVIVSGGAAGVDTTAEQEALRLGLEVVSYRVWQISNEECGVEEWHMGRSPYVRRMVEMPKFGNAPHGEGWSSYEAALVFRNSLIVEKADRVVAFRAAWSPGTTIAMDFAHAYGKPLREYGLSESERLQVA